MLWGLCDGASAALFYAYQDQRVNGLVLLNPWVFTEQSAAKTYLKHYYVKRAVSKDFWRKVLFLKLNYVSSVISLWQILRQAASKTLTPKTQYKMVKVDGQLPLPIRMRECLMQFKYPVLLILSGRDLTADEFKETVKADTEWQSLLNNPQLTRRDFAEADHTFSSAAWQNQIAEWTSDWIKALS